MIAAFKYCAYISDCCYFLFSPLFLYFFFHPKFKYQNSTQASTLLYITKKPTQNNKRNKRNTHTTTKMETVAAIDRVPVEVFEIFKYLKNKERFQCMRVCQLWREPASITYYEEIKLVGTMIDQINSPKLPLIATKKSRVVEAIIKYGKYAQALEISDGNNPSTTALLSPDHFRWLVSQMPNLKALNFGKSCHFGH